MRCFVAIDLAEELKSKIAEIQEKIAEKEMSFVKPENLHITLKFLGELNEQEVNNVCYVLEKIEKERFEISIEGFGVFPSHDTKDLLKKSFGIAKKGDFLYNKNPRIVWVGATGKGLKELVVSIEDRLAENCFAREDKEFSGHLTIARVKGFSRDFYKKYDNLKNVKIGNQLIKEFVLKQSILLPTGPVYKDIKKFELS